MKIHPAVKEDVGAVRKSQNDVQAMVNRIVTEVHGDEDGRSTWMDRQATYYRRRYAREFRNVDWPWPGANDIVMPTIDLTIDKLKAVLARVIFTRPMVTFKATNPDSHSRTQTAEIFYDWLINEGMPDFKNQLLVMLDSVLQHGYGMVKVFWDYRTRNVTRVLNRSDLPREFRDLVPDVEQRLANSPIPVNTGILTEQLKARIKEDFQTNAKERKRLISQKYGLDPEEPKDKEAIERIFRFFRDGKERVVYKTREVIANNPRAVALDPQDVIVPRTTLALEDAARVTHKIFLSESALRSRAKDQGWSKKAVDLVLDSRRSEADDRKRSLARTTFDRDRDEREGVHEFDKTDLIEIWEHYTRMDIDNDGVDELVVMVIHPGTNTLLKDIREVPFQHGELPFVQVKFEVNDHRFYSSRGVPEKIDDIDKEMTKRHRNKLNNMDMMVPTFTYRFASEINPDTINFIPGEMYPVLQPDDIRPLDVPDRTIPDEREENILLTWVERYLGGFDAIASQANISEARTATEVNALQRSASEILAYRTEVIQMGLKKIYGLIWSLWNQWGPEEIHIQVTGEEMRRLTKEEIRGKFDIIPVGTITNTDPEIERQRALQVLDVVSRLAAQPEVLGVKWEVDLGQALANWLEKTSILEASSVIRERDQREIAQIQQQQQQRVARRQAIEDNVPMSARDAQEVIREVKREAPNKGSQRLTGVS